MTITEIMFLLVAIALALVAWQLRCIWLDIRELWRCMADLDIVWLQHVCPDKEDATATSPIDKSLTEEQIETINKIMMELTSPKQERKIYPVDIKTESANGTKVDNTPFEFPPDVIDGTRTVSLLYSAGYDPEWYDVTGGTLRKLTPDEVADLDWEQDDQEADDAPA